MSPMMLSFCLGPKKTRKTLLETEVIAAYSNCKIISADMDGRNFSSLLPN